MLDTPTVRLRSPQAVRPSLRSNLTIGLVLSGGVVVRYLGAVMRVYLVIILLLTMAVVIGARLSGPSDLYDKDQDKTIAYTVDMVRNGRWSVPRDHQGRPATKPPMYNWLAAPVVGGLDAWDRQWALKWPSLAAGLVTVGLCVGMGRWLARQEGYPDGSALRSAQVSPSGLAAPTGLASPWGLGLLAGAIWMASYPTMMLIYRARPDMLLTAFLVGAWVCATALIRSPSPSEGEDRGEDCDSRGSLSRKRRMALAVVLWGCVAGAALTKGPPAVLPLVYIVLASRLIGGRWSAMHRTGWWWGVPLVLAAVGAWLAAAHLCDPTYIKEVLIDKELLGRGEKGGSAPFDFVWKMPAYFVARFAPWSVVAILGLIHVKPRRWFTSPMGPAVLWLLIVVAVFSILPGRQARYLVPAYPAAAILAAWWLLVPGARYRLTPIRAAALSLVIAVGLAGFHLSRSDEFGYTCSDNALAFARQVRARVGDQPVAFASLRTRLLPSLLGRYEPSAPTSDNVQTAPWAIGLVPRNTATGWPMPQITSGPVREGLSTEPVEAGLYRRNWANPAAPQPPSQ